MASEKIESLVSQILQEIDAGGVMSKFILIIEGFDSKGARAIYSSTNENALVWDNLGLLTYAIERDKAVIHRNIINGTEGG